MRHRGPISIKKHPKTGALLTPVGFVNGRAVWPILGASPDDPDDDKDEKDDVGDSGADDKPDDKAGSDGDADKVDKADLDALERRMRAADKRASEAEKKLKEIEDAKKDDLTKASDELTEVRTKLEEAQSENSTLKLQIAFLTANKHTWHDGDTALALAQSKNYLDGVVDEDDGAVDKVALGKALDKLAKEHAYLVKTEKKNDEPDSPSGEPAGSRSDNSKDEKAKQAALKRRFPVLNR